MEEAMNAIVPFHSDLGEVRVIERDGQPWFALPDLCSLLGLKNPTMAARPLDDTEKAKFFLGSGSDGTIVSLPGALTLMVRCKGAMKPGTMPYRVRKWITGEVVPTVLRTGSYGRPASPVHTLALEDLEALVLRQAEQRRALQDEAAQLAPKADALDRIADARGALTFTEAAKVLKLGRNELLDWLHQHRWIYRASGNGRWMGYREKEQQGLIWHRVSRIPSHDGPDKVAQSALITAKGVAKLAELHRG
jgi:prophage antirepressor-like protein